MEGRKASRQRPAAAAYSTDSGSVTPNPTPTASASASASADTEGGHNSSRYPASGYSVSPFTQLSSGGRSPFIGFSTSEPRQTDSAVSTGGFSDVPDTRIHTPLEQKNHYQSNMVIHQDSNLVVIPPAVPSMSPLVRMFFHTLSDNKIAEELKAMIMKGENNFFDQWSNVKRRLFYLSAMESLPKPKLLEKLDVGAIQNSVIFDTTATTNMHTIEASYLRAINHYRAWQFSGSNKIYQFGENGKRICVARNDDTFIFWFRDGDTDIGLIIDGQTLWVEGFLRRTRNNGKTTYSHAIQFSAEDRDSTDEKRNIRRTGERSGQDHIIGADLEVVDHGGRYKGSVSDIPLMIHKVRIAIRVISSHTRGSSFRNSCHHACDLLILYSTEAGKNYWIYQYTMQSLVEHIKPLRLPSSLHTTVTKHKQVTLNAMTAIEGMMAKADNNSDLFSAVPGAPFWKLCQCVDAYYIYGRRKLCLTNFYLQDKESEYKKLKKASPVVEQKHVKGRHKAHAKDKEIMVEVNLSRGTLFREETHGGLTTYKGNLSWSKPPKPSKEVWYGHDESSVQ